MTGSTPKEEDVARLAMAVHLMIRVFLVAGRAGAPAEGKIPFNPLYFHILGHLLREGPTRPSHLASLLGTARTTLSTASKALQSRGLIAPKPDPKDGRAQVIGLTKEGREVAEAIQRQDRENMRVVLSQFDEEEQSQVVTMFERIVAGITASPEA